MEEVEGVLSVKEEEEAVTAVVAVEEEEPHMCIRDNGTRQY